MAFDERLKQATILKTVLRTAGIHVIDNPEGIGETIKEDVMGLYKMDDVKGPKLNELTLYKRITTKLIHNNNSPFKLLRDGDRFFIGYKGRELSDVAFTPRPKHYAMLTSAGTPMKHVAQETGSDCLGISIDKRCHYFTNGTFCRYCNINPTNVESKIERVSDLQDVWEVAHAVGNNYPFIDLTGGTFEDTDEECKYYTKVGMIIKDALGKDHFGGPFSLTPPKDLRLLEKLYDTGVDVVTFNRDVYSDEAFAKICPGKLKIGKAHYDAALQKAKELWGEGNALVQYLIGPWESNDALLEGVKYHLDRGILVNLTTFVPSPKSTFEQTHPKTLKDLLYIYTKYSELVLQSGLYPNKRMSVCTSESANRSSIANEAVKGYMQGYDASNDLRFLEEK